MWTVREVCEACGLGTWQLGQWITRGHYRPSQAVRPGQRRLFDWCDLACLAVMAELRALSLEPHEAGRLVAELRGLLEQRGSLHQDMALFLVLARWDESSDFAETVWLGDDAGLPDIVCRRPKTCLIVDVAGAYQSALARIGQRDRP